MVRKTERIALITGITGQDGFYLAEFLLRRKYKVYGIARDPSKLDPSLNNEIEDIIIMDLLHPKSLTSVISSIAPTEIYHLAAHHFSSQTDRNRQGALQPFIQLNLLVVDQILQTIQSDLPDTRFFYPASAHVFGKTIKSPQDELTPLMPDTPYAISKSAGLYLCRHFRDTHKVFSAVGILYNHESPRRGSTFITTQIAHTAALASIGKPEHLLVRDLDAIVDWGAAEDYVRAMWLMLQRDTPDEYIVASGKGRTVREFALQAFASVGSSAEGLVIQDPAESPAAAVPRVGDSTKLRRQTGWQMEISFEDMVTAMVTAQQRALRQGSD